MKKLIFIFLLLPFAVSAQMTVAAQVTFGTLTDLRSAGGQPNSIVFLNGLSALNDGNGGNYMWNSSSTANDDGFLIIKPTAITTGRWMRLANGNTTKGTSTFSGTGFVSSFVVTHNLGFAPAQIQIQALTQNAATNWVTNITSTQFTVNFATIPLLGTNNINFSWLLIKQ